MNTHLLSLIVFGVTLAASAQTGWAARQSNTRNSLFGIDYWGGDPQNVIAVGSDDVICRSTDGTATWSRESIGTTNTLYDVTFINSDTRFVRGTSGLILFNTIGQRVATVVNSASAPCRFSIVWNGVDDTGMQAAGVIQFCRLYSRPREHVGSEGVVSAKQLLPLR